jgi:hypothetical protein
MFYAGIVMGLAAGAFIMMVIVTVTVGMMVKKQRAEREAEGDTYRIPAAEVRQHWIKQNDLLTDILMVVDK